MQQIKELKIDEELRDLFPPLSKEDYEKLENSLVNRGFDERIPIFTWNGYIADGHNRYEICKKHNISFTEAVLGFDTKEEVMEWMIDIQLGRRNLSPVQRMAIVNKYRNTIEKIKEENNKKMLSGVSENNNHAEPSVPKNGGCNNSHSKSTHTREQLATMADVSPATFTRYNIVINSDNEELKEKMINGDVTVTRAYEIIKESKNPPTNKKTCMNCGEEKLSSEFYGDDTICKECKKHIYEEDEQETPLYDKSETQGGGAFRDFVTGEVIKSSTVGLDEDIMREIKTAKCAIDYVTPDKELAWMREVWDELISNIDDRFFELVHAIEKFDNDDIDIVIMTINDFKGDLDKLITKFTENKENK